MFLQSGVSTDLIAIREALDCGTEFSAGLSVLSLAEALLSLFASLPDSVIPFAQYLLALEVSNSFPRSKSFVASLPRVHRSVLCYIIAFLRELLLHSQTNRLTAQKIGKCSC